MLGLVPGVFENPHLANDRDLAVFTPRKECSQPIKVFLGDGVELVVMAPGALKGQPEESICRNYRRFRLPFRAILIAEERVFHRHRRQRVEASPQATLQTLPLRFRQLVDAFQIQIVRPDFVSRHLLLHENIVGLIRVKGTNHIVAIAPRVGEQDIGFIAPRVCIASHIEPLAPPALTIPR